MVKHYLAPRRQENWVDYIKRLYPDKDSIEITFQVTENCCMACTYCYQNNKTNNRMTWDIAKDFIDLILNDKHPHINTKNCQCLTFQFIGGEPLLEIELIEKICQYTLDQMIDLNHPWLHFFRVSICSNGLLYFDEKVQSFFKKFNPFVSFAISIDGNEQLHDSCRLDLNGNPTYKRAMAAVKHYNEHFSYGIPMPTKMTLAPSNIIYMYDAVINLVNEGYEEINLNCIFENGWNEAHAKIMYEQLVKIADYFIENNIYKKTYLSLFDEDMFSPLPIDDLSNWCGGLICDGYKHGIAIDYKGDYYTCIRFMDSSLNHKQKSLPIGNVHQGYISTEEYQQNYCKLCQTTRRSQSTDECFYCPIAKGCAWCSAYNYEEFGTPNKRATYICCMHKARALANAYYWNKLYQKLNLQQKFKLYLSKEEALKIISEDEYNKILQLESRGDEQLWTIVNPCS